MADPSAPSMASTNNEPISGDSRTNLHLPQSPVFTDSPYPTSPSTSTGFTYSAPSRSVTDLQAPSSPKVAVQQTPPPQQQHQQQQQQYQPVKNVTPSQQTTPKPSIVIQQCKYLKHIYLIIYLVY